MAIKVDQDAARLLQPLPVNQPRRPIAEFSAQVQRAAARPEPAVEPAAPAAAGPAVAPAPTPRAALTVRPAALDLGNAGGPPQRLVDLLNDVRGRAEIAALGRRGPAQAAPAAPPANGGANPALPGAFRLEAQASPLAFIAPQPVVRAPLVPRNLLADADRIAERLQQLAATGALGATQAQAPAPVFLPPVRHQPLIDQQI